MIINNSRNDNVDTVLRFPTLLDVASKSVQEQVIRLHPEYIQYTKHPSESLQLLAMVSGDDIFQYINYPTEKVRLYEAFVNGNGAGVELDATSVLKVYDTINGSTNNSICINDIPEDNDMTDDGKNVCLNTISYMITVLLTTHSFSKFALLKVIWKMIFRKDRRKKPHTE